jgi:hypothetical protein
MPRHQGWHAWVFGWDKCLPEIVPPSENRRGVAADEPHADGASGNIETHGQTLLWWRFKIVLLRFGLDREACDLPSAPTAHEGACIRPPRLSQLLRHTGARGFLWSGAICHQPGIMRQIELNRALSDVIRWESQRPMRLSRARVECAISANVQHHDWRAGLP